MTNEIERYEAGEKSPAIQQGANAVVFDMAVASNLIKFGEFMANAGEMLPKHLQGNPTACAAVAMQAAAWNMNPFTVGQKTHIVNGTMGYEAQLVNAVISSSKAIHGRFHYRTIGDWSQLKINKQWIAGQNGKKGYNKQSYSNSQGLGIQVGAILYGESEITWDDPLYLDSVEVKNSPLWWSRPIQQIKYLGVKHWGRIYCPEVILGVYTPDELYEENEFSANKGTEKVINTGDDDLAALLNQGQPTESAFENYEQSDQVSEMMNSQNEPEFEEFSIIDTCQQAIDEMSTPGECDEISQYISEKIASGDIDAQGRNKLLPLFKAKKAKILEVGKE